MQDDHPSEGSSQSDPDPVPDGGGLVLVSTPIGNLGDVTFRAIAILRHCDVILCEDTRMTARLLQAHGISTRCEALHEHNEERRIASVLARLRQGARVALVSDAGTPLVSDPGYRLVRACIAAGLRVTGAPGANAAVLALTLSGLPPHPFLFLGFAPVKPGARRTQFEALRAAEKAGLFATMIWYEAPHRVGETLADMARAFGSREAAVARELTKKFEEVRRGTLPDLAADHVARGEIVILVGPGAPEAIDEAEIDRMLRETLNSMSMRDAVAMVSERSGVARRLVYARALALGAGQDR